MKPKEFMLEALAISKQALPKCRPNPPVGCVITYQDKIVASGYTQEPGERHAEIMAIDNCKYKLAECELYVTLEPCSFFGRTPACTERLIKVHPKKIYIAMLDSDPRNNGRGLGQLREANLDVELGLAQSEVNVFLFPYLTNQ